MIRESDEVTGDDPPQDLKLTRNNIFELLSSERRRMILHYLEDSEAPVPLRDLAKYIAASEEDVDESELTDDEIRRVYISLYQYHIPKMDDLEVISYDRDEGTIALEEPSKLLFPYLHLDPTRELEPEKEGGFLKSARSWFQRE
jgi:hypothetical protein